MKKIPCLFVRDFSDRRRPVITRQVQPGLELVLDGAAIPTRKYDGTACFFSGGKLYKRHDVKSGRPVPEGAIPCEPAPDATTGHWPHWVEVGTGPEDRRHVEALSGLRASDGSRFRPRLELDDGLTYELVGPLVNGNPDGFQNHSLIRHGEVVLPEVGPLRCPFSFDELRAYLEMTPIEGVVWWTLDDFVAEPTFGPFTAEQWRRAKPVAKLRRADFGFSWPVKAPKEPS